MESYVRLSHKAFSNSSWERCCSRTKSVNTWSWYITSLWSNCPRSKCAIIQATQISDSITESPAWLITCHGMSLPQAARLIFFLHLIPLPWACLSLQGQISCSYSTPTIWFSAHHGRELSYCQSPHPTLQRLPILLLAQQAGGIIGLGYQRNGG